MKILLSRLLDKKTREQNEKIASERKMKIGTGDRSEKIRTYNFPQNRVTDHRIGLTLHRLSEVMDGDFQELTDNLIAFYQTEALKGQSGEQKNKANDSSIFVIAFILSFPWKRESSSFYKCFF